MLDWLVTLLMGPIGPALRRGARLAAFAALTLGLALIAFGAGLAAAFIALERSLGAIEAALIVAAGAAALAGLASIPLWTRRAPPPPSAVASLANVAIAVALGLLADRKSKKGAP